jgi:hypothetical protein
VLGKRAKERIELALGWWCGAQEAYPSYLTGLLYMRR